MQRNLYMRHKKPTQCEIGQTNLINETMEIKAQTTDISVGRHKTITNIVQIRVTTMSAGTHQKHPKELTEAAEYGMAHHRPTDDLRRKRMYKKQQFNRTNNRSRFI